MWQLAWRNLWRNRMRSLILGGAVTWTFALFLVTLGLQADQHGQMSREAARSIGGDLLLHAEGWWRDQSADAVLTLEPAALERLGRVEGVAHVVPRVVSFGLIQSARESAGARLVGVSPEGAAAFDDPARWLVEGTFLTGDDVAPLVLGAPVVHDLQVALGDRIVWMASGPDGEVRRSLFRLTGIVDSGSATRDRATAWTTLAAAQEALGMDEAITQVGFGLARDGDPTAVETTLRATLAALASEGTLRAPVELLTWQQAMPEMVGFMRVDALYGVFFLLVLFLVVSFGIANTFLMVLLERIRELGLLGALGMGPRRIGLLVLAEFAMLVSTAMLVGLALALIGHAVLVHVGIDLRAFSEDLEMGGIAMDGMVIRSRLVLSQWIAAAGAVVSMALASALYPAWKASRLDPATAMRTWA